MVSLNTDGYRDVVVKGTPNLNEGYTLGTTTIQGNFGFEAQMRYSAATDVVEFIGSDHKSKELLRRPYITANFGGKGYSILEYYEGDTEKLAYFNSLNNGKVQLLFRPKKNLANGRYSFVDGQIIRSYEDLSMFYIKNSGKPALNFRLSKKNILNLLHDKTNNLKDFILKYDLNLTKGTRSSAFIDVL